MTYVLLTRAPLYRGRSPFSLDLHVLGAPLTFVLSQDQTLQFESCRLAVRLAPSRRQFFHSDFACSSRLRRSGSSRGPAISFAGFRSAQFSRTEGNTRFPAGRETYCQT